MEISFLKEQSRKEWNQFLFENQGSFLQSFEWGEFQKSLAKKIWRIVIRENNEVLSQALVIKEVFPFRLKSHFYIPFGPCLKKVLSPERQSAVLEQILTEAHRLSKAEKAVFLKIEPFSEFSFPKIFPSKVPRKRTQPQKTLILDLKKSEQEILKSFSSGTRYNIRLSEKKGVRIKFRHEYLGEFYGLVKKAAKRNEFKPFDEEHYKKLFNVKSDDFKVKLCLAEYQEKIIAAYILILFNKTASVLHGASDWEYRALKASNLLQWERIKLVKHLGYEQFDFWGIDEKKWPGITAFKKGFCKEELKYPLARDIIFQKIWYRTYHILRKLK